MEELVKELRKPFPPHAVRAKIQATSANAALAVFYIDARHVSERLNQLVPGRWYNKFMPITLADQVGIECTIGISFDEGAMTRSDIGTMQATLEQGGGLKAMYSDAFKRAAVHLGIGVSLYDQERNIWIPKEKNGVEFLKVKGDKIVGLKPAAEEQMAAKYKKWLDDTGIEKFGQPVEVT